jgi:hypothetical protein
MSVDAVSDLFRRMALGAVKVGLREPTPAGSQEVAWKKMR